MKVVGHQLNTSGQARTQKNWNYDVTIWEERAKSTPIYGQTIFLLKLIRRKIGAFNFIKIVAAGGCQAAELHRSSPGTITWPT